MIYIPFGEGSHVYSLSSAALCLSEDLLLRHLACSVVYYNANFTLLIIVHYLTEQHRLLG